MTEDNEKTLPKDTDSDYSLPGRLEEGNSAYFEEEPIKSKTKNRTILVIAISLVVTSVFFSYYFMNQNEIDSRIIQNTMILEPEEKLVNQFNVGEYGSDHTHAAIAVFVDGVQINFGLPQFQLSSKYIHFEDHSSYLIHKHATSVPLEMLFASFEMKITSDCIVLNYDESTDIKTSKYCNGQDKFLVFYVNGEQYYSDVSRYVLEHNDRILISFGNGESILKHLSYLESLKILDIPQKTPKYSGNEIIL
ncbi:MAG: hypothetical protein QQN45_01845 [Nitrosopumilus sp.]